jgi:SAM-dependent methyltransferase
VGRIDWGDLRRVKPISKKWGFDRGLPIDRYYIEQFLAKHANDVRGHALEIGDNTYTYRYGAGRITNSDILHVVEGTPRATIIADLTHAPQIQDGMFDCIICTQTLQLIYELPAAVQTLHRVLKPRGVLLATVPGVSRIAHGDGVDADYWRFTTASATRLFENSAPGSFLEIDAYGNVFTASAFLYGLAAEELTSDELNSFDSDFQTIIGVRMVKR